MEDKYIIDYNKKIVSPYINNGLYNNIYSKWEAAPSNITRQQDLGRQELEHREKELEKKEKKLKKEQEDFKKEQEKMEEERKKMEEERKAIEKEHAILDEKRKKIEEAEFQKSELNELLT